MMKDEKLGVEVSLDELEPAKDLAGHDTEPSPPPDMVPPKNRETPVSIDEVETTHVVAERVNGNGNGNGNGGGSLDPWDLDAILAAFRKLPEQEQRERLVNLFVSSQSENAVTRRELKNHEAEDRQEFACINDTLDHLTRCVESVAARFEVTLPTRPKERPRRRE